MRCRTSGATGGHARPGELSPVVTESAPLPGNDRRRLDDDDGFTPSPPQAGQP